MEYVAAWNEHIQEITIIEDMITITEKIHINDHSNDYHYNMNRNSHSNHSNDYHYNMNRNSHSNHENHDIIHFHVNQDILTGLNQHIIKTGNNHIGNLKQYN